MQGREKSGDTTESEPFKDLHSFQKNASGHEENCVPQLPQWLEPLFFGGFLGDVERQAVNAQIGRQFSKLIEEEVLKNEARKKAPNRWIVKYEKNEGTRKPEGASKPPYKVRLTSFLCSTKLRVNIKCRKLAKATLMKKNRRH